MGKSQVNPVGQIDVAVCQNSEASKTHIGEEEEEEYYGERKQFGEQKRQQ